MPRVSHARHRYPACIVWTPIPPITALCPYIGHVGVCSSEGVVFDWVGIINRDHMAFGWPVRYIQFDPVSAEEWDEKVHAAVEIFNSARGPAYNFILWNCHSLLAHFLNDLQYGQGDQRAPLYRRWNVVTLCAAFFLTGRFTTAWGVLQTFGPTVAAYAIAGAIGGWQTVFYVFRVACYINAAFVGWFILATACAHSGMHGRWKRLQPSIADSA